MREVDIRRAADADLDVLVRTFGDEDFFVDRLAKQADGHGVLLTAWARSELIGHVYLWLADAEEEEVREHLPGVPLLNRIEVHPGHRNRLVGTQLVAVAERILSKRGYSHVALAVRIDNLDAFRLYERLGYQVWSHPPVVCMYDVRLADGTRKRCPETCYMMVKQLTGSSA